MDDLYIKWKTMWDAQEHTTQLFFLANAFIGIYIASRPLRANAEGSIAKRGITCAFGIGYLILVIIAYFQLVPTYSPYE